MTIDVQSALLGALVVVAVVAGVLLGQRGRRIDRLFAVFGANLVFWFASDFLSSVASVGWFRARIALSAFIPVTLAAVLVELIRGEHTRLSHLKRWLYPSAILLSVLGFSSLAQHRALQAATATYAVIAILLVARAIMLTADRSRAVEYARSRYLTVAAVAATILVALAHMPMLGDITKAGGNAIVMLYVFFLSQAILRDRLLDLQEFLSRMLVLAVLASLFAAISTGLILGFGDSPHLRAFNTVVSVIVLLTLYEPLKERLEARSAQIFFRERYGLTNTLEGLRRVMLRTLDPRAMSALVLDTVYDARRCTHGAIYILEGPLGRGFLLEASRGGQPPPRVNEREYPELWHAIQKSNEPLLTEEVARSREGQEGGNQQDLLSAMRAVNADVLVPFRTGHRVLGFLSLRDDRFPEPYASQEIMALRGIAETSVIVIENSQLTQRMVERDRLATIGEMAAGLAHEIRNPLGAIKGAAEILEPQRGDPEEQAEFLRVIIDESKRLDTVVSQFLDYARPFRAKLSPTDLNEIVRRTAKLVDAQPEYERAELNLDLDPELGLVEVDGEQIKQVILNLVLNAIQAIGPSGAPITIKTICHEERERVELQVRDRGPGIAPEALAHLFIPFFTTKATGTGLGLAVCQRIINNHGGDIRVRSEEGEGTVFIVRLPLVGRAESGISGTPKPLGASEAIDALAR